MTRSQAPDTDDEGVRRLDTANYRSLWMFLKELEFRQGFVDVRASGVAIRTRP